MDLNTNKINILPESLANQIAAGEVVERPASVLKELVENSIDAGASEVEVLVEDYGTKSLIVRDNGSGMSKEDLLKSLERHATSKIQNIDDLFNINSFGFRGEALPSIASVSRFTMISNSENGEGAWSIAVEGGKKGEMTPNSLQKGTVIEIKDLFFNTPARLKFLKAKRTELEHLQDTFIRLAIANPKIRFKFSSEGKELLRFGSVQGELLEDMLPRLRDFMGKNFVENAVPVDNSRDDMRISGFVSLPTFNLGSNRKQYIYVNGRPVKDKLLMGAFKQAYHDLLHGGRHPAGVLFLEVNPKDIDVNVHPAKAEVRFKNGREVFSLIRNSIRMALDLTSQKVSSSPSIQALEKFEIPAGFVVTQGSSEQQEGKNNQNNVDNSSYQSVQPSANIVGIGSGVGANVEGGSYNPQEHFQSRVMEVQENSQQLFEMQTFPEITTHVEPRARDLSVANYEENTMGAAIAQLHGTYIVSQTKNGMIIVDQHAAHERLVYEKFKVQVLTGQVESQVLLIPEIIEMSVSDVDFLMERDEELFKFGLEVERFGEGAVSVRGTPAILGEVDCKSLVFDVIDDIRDMKKETALQTYLEELLGTMACHGSIRANRKLSIEDMNGILRGMEETPNSAQCNHGRPTYVKLALPEIEKLFGRR